MTTHDAGPSGLSLPAPRVLDPSGARPLRWGVIGTGIGARFVAALHANTPQRVVVWAARDAARTQAVARRHGVDRVRTDLRLLVEDPEVDAVYIATPHPLHREQALAAISAKMAEVLSNPKLWS